MIEAAVSVLRTPLASQLAKAAASLRSAITAARLASAWLNPLRPSDETRRRGAIINLHPQWLHALIETHAMDEGCMPRERARQLARFCGIGNDEADAALARMTAHLKRPRGRPRRQQVLSQDQ